MFGNSVLVDKFQCIKTSCFFSFGIAMLHLLKSVYTRYIARSGLFSIWYLKFTALKCNFSANTNWFSVSTVSNILCIEMPAYRLCGFMGVLCTTANIRIPQRTVCTIQRFTVSQRNCMRAITISPFLLSCALQRWKSVISTLKGQKQLTMIIIGDAHDNGSHVPKCLMGLRPAGGTSTCSGLGRWLHGVLL